MQDFRQLKILRLEDEIMLEYAIPYKDIIRQYTSKFFLYLETKTLIYKSRIDEKPKKPVYKPVRPDFSIF